MKKIFATLLIVCSVTLCKAQWVTIPDPNFVAWLQANYPTCMNGNLMDTTCSGIMNATNVSCGYQNIFDLTGIQYFDNLDTLTCYNNEITFLPPVLPHGLIRLECGGNPIYSLPDSLPHSLQVLICEYCQLTTLPSLPSSLIALVCNENMITNMPTLPSGIKDLEFQGNQITSIQHILPPSLIILRSSNNPLQNFPPFCSHLQWLECAHNNLNHLPVISDNLIVLDCSGNQITNLPTLPIYLQQFNCSSNLLNTIPFIPQYVLNFDCSYNQLTSISNCSTSIDEFNCSHNLLECLPELPTNYMYELNCSYNSNLIDFPTLPDIHNLNFDGTSIHCLPNSFILYGTSHPALDTFLYCGYGTFSCFNSITDIRIPIQLSIYPNPTNETVTVQFSQQGNCKLEITNTVGQIVFAKAINHKTETINLQSLPSGLYFCSVKTEDGKTAQQKLIVQH